MRRRSSAGPQYLANRKKEHPFLKRWFELAAQERDRPTEFEAAAREFQAKVEEVNEEKNTVDEKNKIKLGLNPSRNAMSQADLVSLSIDQYNLWRDLFAKSQKDAGGALKTPDGVFYYGSGKIDRFLSGEWKRRLDSLQRELADLKKALPPQYPFLQTIKDSAKPRDIRVAIRGDANNRGEVAPRHLPSILCDGEPKPFHEGQRPAGTGGGASRPGESADRAGDGEPHLAASFRPGHRGDAQQFRATGRRGRRIRSCWITWRRGSWRTTGR